MRKMASSGKTSRSTRFSSRADARSRPNGFSMIARAFVVQLASANCLITAKTCSEESPDSAGGRSARALPQPGEGAGSV